MLSFGWEKGGNKNKCLYIYLHLHKYWKNALENNGSNHLRLGVWCHGDRNWSETFIIILIFELYESGFVCFLCSRLMPRVRTNFLFFFPSTSCKWPHVKLLFWKSRLKGAAVPQHPRCRLREPASRGAGWTRSLDSSAPGGCGAQCHSGGGVRNSARDRVWASSKTTNLHILNTRHEIFFLRVNTSSQGLIWRVNDA